MKNCLIDITPRLESESIKKTNFINTNHSNQDFWSLKNRLVDFTRQRFGINGTESPRTFNDLIESSIVILLLENMAFLGDTLSFKLDQLFNEYFIDSVTQIENAFRLSKLVGFKPTPPIAAKTFWSASLNNPILRNISIETPILIDTSIGNTQSTVELFAADSDGNPIFDQNIEILAGDTINQSIVGLEGRTTSDTFRGDGTSNQQYTTSNSSVIYDSVEVEIDGVTWVKVDYFTDSNPRREFLVEYDSNWNATILFGNNKAGLIPSNGSQIIITYRIGGGTAGNIVSNFIEVQRQVFIPGLDFSVTVTYVNYTNGKNGYNGDTLDDIKNKLPKHIYLQDRIVSIKDLKIFSEQFTTPYHGIIGKAKVALRERGCAGNIVDLIILARDGNNLIEATPQLKSKLLEEINNKGLMGINVCIRDGEVLSVDINVDVVLDKIYKKMELEFKNKILNKINSFFEINNWEFGKILEDIDLIKELSDLKEIDSTNISFVINSSDEEDSNKISPKFWQIIRPSDINITFVFV